MSDVITFRPDKKLIKWLRGIGSGRRSDTINDVLVKYHNGSPIEKELLERMKKFEITLDEIKGLLDENTK